VSNNISYEQFTSSNVFTFSKNQFTTNIDISYTIINDGATATSKSLQYPPMTFMFLIEGVRDDDINVSHRT
jgi:hypothetical protein